jgi:hypothetical protein
LAEITKNSQKDEETGKTNIKGENAKFPNPLFPFTIGLAGLKYLLKCVGHSDTDQPRDHPPFSEKRKPG